VVHAPIDLSVWVKFIFMLTKVRLVCELLIINLIVEMLHVRLLLVVEIHGSCVVVTIIWAPLVNSS